MAKHKSVIVYCATIKQANEFQTLIPGSMVVTSETGKKDRETAVKRLKSGDLKVLLNVGIYTVGFDYPALDAIVLLRPTRSLRLHSQILGRVSRIAEGKTIAEPLAETDIFPAMVVQMIAVGEATGALDTMLAKIADFYDDEVDTAVDAMTALLEPFMMVFLGGVVGGMIIAMYLPIFKMASVVGG